MNIQERIKYFTENMNLNFFIKSTVKLEILDNELAKFTKRELKGERCFKYTSQDLRSYILALEKVHKALNKKISFYEFDKYLEKKYAKLDGKTLTLETHKLAQYINGARICQMLLSRGNYWATITKMIEMQYQQEKEASDEVFNHEILSGLLEIF
jgi:hypothetical protein